MNLGQNLRLEKRNRILTESRRAAEEEIRFLSRHDALTGLLNRRELESRLDQALGRVLRQGDRLAVLFLDLDRLKHINDTYGHAAGDAGLRIVGSRVGLCVREMDLVARYGGDEFVIVLERIEAFDASDVALSVAERILLQLERGFEHEARKLDLSGSIGISLFPEHGTGPRELIEAADRAMYEAKGQGGGRAAILGE